MSIFLTKYRALEAETDNVRLLNAGYSAPVTMLDMAVFCLQ